MQAGSVRGGRPDRGLRSLPCSTSNTYLGEKKLLTTLATHDALPNHINAVTAVLQPASILANVMYAVERNVESVGAGCEEGGPYLAMRRFCHEIQLARLEWNINVCIACSGVGLLTPCAKIAVL